MDLLICILIGYGIGSTIGYFWDKHVSSPNYGIDGKKEVENYMSTTYGKDWFEQFKKK